MQLQMPRLLPLQMPLAQLHDLAMSSMYPSFLASLWQLVRRLLPIFRECRLRHHGGTTRRSMISHNLLDGHTLM